MNHPSDLPSEPQDNSSERVLLLAVLVLLVLVGFLGYLVYDRFSVEPTTPSTEKEVCLLNGEEPCVSDTESDADAVLLDEEATEDEVAETLEDAPLLFATMTHLEGNWDMALVNEQFFNRQAEYLRTAYAYAQEYDATITIESEIPMAEAMVKWGENLLQEALDAEQGVGTHCDTTPTERFTVAELIEELTARQEAVNALVDPSENLGCAGAGGVADWYEGMVGAGFKYIGGLVGFHYLAMDESTYPAGWDFRSILNEYFHDHAPQDDDLRYYPFRISEVGFTPDPDGDLVVSAGDVGQITAIAESLESGTWDGGCDGQCEFTQEDVDALIEFIRNFDETRDRTRVAKLQVYIPSQVYDDPMIEYFFAELQKLQEEDVMQWASQKEVYEAFVAWETR